MTNSYRRPHDSPACPCPGCEAFDRKLSEENESLCACCSGPPGFHRLTATDESTRIKFKRCPNDPDQSDPNVPIAPAVCAPASLADDGWRPNGLRPLTDLIACVECGTLILKGDDKPRHCPRCIATQCLECGRADGGHAILGLGDSNEPFIRCSNDPDQSPYKGMMGCCACGAFVHDPGPEFVGVMCPACAANGGPHCPLCGSPDHSSVDCTFEIASAYNFQWASGRDPGTVPGDSEALKLANAMSSAAELNLLEDWPGTDVR